MNTDIVIPFIQGPRDSIELRYALRSIDKNLESHSIRIWLYGDKPGWIEHVEHVPVEREPRPKFAKFYDQMRKIKMASENEQIGSNFIYTYDDVYLMKPVDCDTLRTPRALKDMSKEDDKQWFSHTDAGANWVECMKNTLYYLKYSGKLLYNYETHLPRVYNKVKSLVLFEQVASTGMAFQFATMYFNHFVTDPELLSENKYFKLGIYHPIGYRELKEQAERSSIMNVSAAYEDSIQLLESFFPHKSRWEK